jgi:hypothetical protein
MDGTLSTHLPSEPHTTAKDFRSWLASARAGDRFAYYFGFLALGTDLDGRRLPEPACRDALVVARAAWAAADRGLVHLVQRRLGENRFEYLAVARRQAFHHEGG